MGKITRPTIILALIAFVATFALSHVRKITYPNIQKQDKQKQENALAMAMPGFKIKEEKTVRIEGTSFTYWIGEKIENNATTRGYAFISEKGGYGGPIKSVVGVDEKGSIIGISIIQQSETPGLGSRSTEIASRETFWGHYFGGSSSGRDHAGLKEESVLPWFQEQFTGLNVNKKIEIVKKGDWNPAMREELLARNSISAITGATITTKAVKDGIEAGILKLNKALEMEKAAAEVRK